MRSPLSFAQNTMISVEKIKNIADLKIAESTNFIVDISVKSGNRIVVLLDNDKGVSIADCVAMSRHIEFSLDREVEDFELEVSSAGLTEPFKVIKQYEKNIGNEVETLTKTGEKYNGILTEVRENEFVIEIEKMVKPEGSKRKTVVIENLTFKYEEIKHTKYIIRFK